MNKAIRILVSVFVALMVASSIGGSIGKFLFTYVGHAIPDMMAIVPLGLSIIVSLGLEICIAVIVFKYVLNKLNTYYEKSSNLEQK